MVVKLYGKNPIPLFSFYQLRHSFMFTLVLHRPPVSRTVREAKYPVDSVSRFLYYTAGLCVWNRVTGGLELQKVSTRFFKGKR